MTTRTNATLPAGWALESITEHCSHLLWHGQWRAVIGDGGNTADTIWALTVRREVSDPHLAADTYGPTALAAALNWLAATA
ncbi:MAG: hypothetical protein M0R37_11900 [Bacteroidales bacterium]|jgi:hypothetical protein|nr:hypothetical protein [Bacteroidales bacterium]